MQDLQKVIEEQNKAIESVGTKDLSTQILARVESLKKDQGLTIPEGYNPTNALKAAQLILSETKDKNNNPVLSVCSPMSISNALLQMIEWGLDPNLDQCYFIANGQKLSFRPSVYGKVAFAKRMRPELVHEVAAMAIYEGEEYELDIEKCKYVVKSHKPDAKAINNGKIIAVYAYAYDKNGKITASNYMSMTQIEHSWGGITGGAKTNFQKMFPEEAAKRTVIARMVKPIYKEAVDNSNNELLKQMMSFDKDEIEEQKANFTNVEDESNKEPDNTVEISIEEETETKNTEELEF